MLRIFGNSRNSPTIPLDCRCFRFFLPSHLASSVRRFRSVPSSLDACFWNFDNSRSLCRTVRAVVQHSLPKIVTHARSHCRQFFFFFIQFLVDRQEISRFPPTIFEISHSLALSFANSGRSSFIFSFFRSYPRSFRIRKLSTLHCDVLWMFTLKKRKKEILRQFQIAILPKKILDFASLVNTSLSSPRYIAFLSFTPPQFQTFTRAIPLSHSTKSKRFFLFSPYGSYAASCVDHDRTTVATNSSNRSSSVRRNSWHLSPGRERLATPPSR